MHYLVIVIGAVGWVIVAGLSIFLLALAFGSKDEKDQSYPWFSFFLGAIFIGVLIPASAVMQALDSQSWIKFFEFGAGFAAFAIVVSILGALKN